MALVKIKKVQIITLKSYQKIVLEFLQKEAVFEVVDVVLDKECCKKDLHVLEKKVADLDFAINNLSSLFENKRSFSYAMMGEREVFSEKRVLEVVSQFEYGKVVENVQNLEVAGNKLKSELKDIDNDLLNFGIFENLEFSFSEYKKQDSVKVVF